MSIKEMIELYEDLAFCGVYCGECKHYKQNLNCKGCRNEFELIEECSFRACASSKKLIHCGECTEFPCTELNAFYNDGDSFHDKAKCNMDEMRCVGADCWIKSRRQKI